MAGFTLEDVGERISWRAVLGLAKHAGPGSALYRQGRGKDAPWTLEAQLLAILADIGNVANWQRGNGKGLRPTPIPRPGVKDDSAKFGGDPVSPAAFDNFWN